MKKAFLVVFMFSGFISCNAQKNDSKIDILSKADTAQNNPQVCWKVNKQFDKHGNLISYDSTYTWSFSNNGSEKDMKGVDSFMNAFEKQFNEGFPSFFKKSFIAPMLNDSLFYHDPLTYDYFRNKQQFNYYGIKKMIQGWDSLRTVL